MLHQLSIHTVEYFLSVLHKPIDEDQKEIYIYGMECFLNTSIPLLLIVIWGIINHCIFETFTWIFAFSFLRQYTGGYHASSQWICITSTTLLGCTNTLIINSATLTPLNVTLLYFVAFLLTISVCPIASPQKPLLHTQYKQHKKYVCIILSAYIIFSYLLPSPYALSICYAVFTCFILVIITIFPSSKNMNSIHY